LSWAHYGRGTGPILLDEVECSGNELSLDQCKKSDWGQQNCDHIEDAGVSCDPFTGADLQLCASRVRPVVLPHDAACLADNPLLRGPAGLLPLAATGLWRQRAGSRWERIGARLGDAPVAFHECCGKAELNPALTDGHSWEQ